MSDAVQSWCPRCGSVCDNFRCPKCEPEKTMSDDDKLILDACKAMGIVFLAETQFVGAAMLWLNKHCESSCIIEFSHQGSPWLVDCGLDNTDNYEGELCVALARAVLAVKQKETSNG